MKDKSWRPVAHIVIRALRKDYCGYGMACPTEVTKIGCFTTEEIAAQVQTDLLKAKP